MMKIACSQSCDCTAFKTVRKTSILTPTFNPAANHCSSTLGTGAFTWTMCSMSITDYGWSCTPFTTPGHMDTHSELVLP
jgi:hypothetical protein